MILFLIQFYIITLLSLFDFGYHLSYLLLQVLIQNLLFFSLLQRLMHLNHLISFLIPLLTGPRGRYGSSSRSTSVPEDSKRYRFTPSIYPNAAQHAPKKTVHSNPTIMRSKDSALFTIQAPPRTNKLEEARRSHKVGLLWPAAEPAHDCLMVILSVE